MKQRKNKKKCFVGMLCMLLSGIFLLTAKPLPVQAADKLYKWKSSYTIPVYKDKGYNWDDYTLRLTDSRKTANKIDVVSLKSSNSKVASVNFYGATDIQLNTKKAGSTKIEICFTFKGKTYRYKTTVKVKKYENPFKSLKIGNAKLTSRLNKRPAADFYGEGTLKYKLKKGWKIKEIYYRDVLEDGDWGEKKTIGNYEKVKIEGWDYINVKCYNRSKKMTVDIMVGGGVQTS